MIIARITARALHIPFKQAFVHAAASRLATQSILVTAEGRNGMVGIGEGCPREYVTGESVATALGFVAMNRHAWQASIGDVATLAQWVERHRRDIDAHPAAWTAVELALLDLIGQAEGRSVEALLGLPPLAGRFRYTAVLGDAAPAAFAAQLAAYLDAGFCDFKIKLCGQLECDRKKVGALHKAGVSASAVRADANNLWLDADSAIRCLDALDFPFPAMEEPLRPGDFAGMRRVSEALDTWIVLDESMLRADELDEICADAHRWIANVRVSKMGGLLRCLQFLVAARRARVPIIIGAHVGETSVLTRAGLTLTHSLRGDVVACEGAAGTHLLAHDVVEPTLMFGNEGVIDVSALPIRTREGFGWRRSS